MLFKNTQGEWVQEPFLIKEEAINNFNNTYSNEVECSPEITSDYVQSFGISSLMDNHVEKLDKPFAHMEIETAFFQMDGNKTPGLDGFPGKFY